MGKETKRVYKLDSYVDKLRRLADDIAVYAKIPKIENYDTTQLQEYINLHYKDAMKARPIYVQNKEKNSTLGTTPQTNKYIGWRQENSAMKRLHKKNPKELKAQKAKLSETYMP